MLKESQPEATEGAYDKISFNVIHPLTKNGKLAHLNIQMRVKPPLKKKAFAQIKNAIGTMLQTHTETLEIKKKISKMKSQYNATQSPTQCTLQQAQVSTRSNAGECL